MRALGWLGIAVIACGGKVDTARPPAIAVDDVCSGVSALQPVTVVDSPVGPFAVSSAGFFWGIRDAFGWSSSRDGNPVVKSTDRFNIAGATADDAAGYFTSLGYPTPSGQITRLRPGGGPEVLADGLVNPAAIADDEHDIYFVDSGIPSTSNTAGKIWKLSKSGGGPRQFVNGLGYPNELATKGRYLYWVDAVQGDIARADKTSGAVDVLFRTKEGVTDFALGDGVAYWVNERSLGRVDLVTGESRILAGLFDREGVSDWPEVAASERAVFVSAALPDDPSKRGLYMLTDGVDSGSGLVELDRDVGDQIVVTDRAVFYVQIVPDAWNRLAMICL
jgi:hypothetical protein